MDFVNILNILLYLAIGVLAVAMCRRGLWVLGVSLAALALHGAVYNAVYLYRDLVWESCPPLCGLQEWAPAIRMHGLITIVTCAVARLTLGGSGG